MSVLAKITKRVLRPSKGSFRVNHPRGAEQRTKPRREGFWIPKRGECSVEAESVLRMKSFESVHKLAPEYLLEHLDGQKELLLRVYPVRVVRRQTSGGTTLWMCGWSHRQAQYPECRRHACPGLLSISSAPRLQLANQSEAQTRGRCGLSHRPGRQAVKDSGLDASVGRRCHHDCGESLFKQGIATEPHIAFKTLRLWE